MFKIRNQLYPWFGTVLLEGISIFGKKCVLGNQCALCDGYTQPGDLRKLFNLVFYHMNRFLAKFSFGDAPSFQLVCHYTLRWEAKLIQACANTGFEGLTVCYRNPNVFCGENFCDLKTPKIIRIGSVFVEIEFLEDSPNSNSVSLFELVSFQSGVHARIYFSARFT